jgi:hypothetical protein
MVKMPRRRGGFTPWRPATSSMLAVLANTVLNAGNIKSLTGAITGVPVSASTVTLGSLSGSSSLTESTKQAEKAVGGGDKDKSNKSLIKKGESFITSWLDVKVIGFDTDEDDENEKKKQEM